jgi:head-tail adaptor
MAIGAGQLDVLVVIQEQSDPTDHTLYTDCTGGEVWINLRPLQGREKYEAQANKPRVTSLATGRWWPGLTGAHRFKRRDDGRIIELLSDPLEIERQAWFQVDCCERDDDGE